MLSGLRVWALITVWSLLKVHGASLTREAASIQLPQSPRFPGYQLISVVGDTRFEVPVGARTPPGETNRLFVVERTGRIAVITNLSSPNRSVFLDLPHSVHSFNVESGLLALEFHPGFATNGYFYVFRVSFVGTAGLRNILSRFQVSPDHPNVCDPATEMTVFSLPDVSTEHNGADLRFGPDGFLYLSMGDRGHLQIAQDNLQPLDRHLNGAILRIDVDARPDSLVPNALDNATLNFRVPAGNPFVGVTDYQGLPVDATQLRTELYAVGLRNPWRFTFHPVTGDLYCGDVGSAYREEINRVVPGGNYGWPYLEDDIPVLDLPKDFPRDFRFIPPVHAYRNGAEAGEGRAVIGGMFYQGGQIPSLAGRYVFADNVRGHIWSMELGPGGQAGGLERLAGSVGISEIARDPRDGELLFVNHLTGGIDKLIHTAESESNVPLRLSGTGAFSTLDTLAPATGVVAYSINLPFWSDRAIKSRWFALPTPQASFGFQASSNWFLPAGAIWIKHFEMEMIEGEPASRRRLETRFLVRNETGAYGLTYRWDETQKEALLVPQEGLDELLTIQEPAGILRTQQWRYPSHSECVACHTRVGGHAVGFNTHQLNRDIRIDGADENQLEVWHSAGILTGVPQNSNRLPAHVPQGETHAPLLQRVRSYLAANCSPCHQPGSMATLDAFWDARPQTPLADARIIGSYITPHDTTNSLILQRLLATDRRMPPFGTALINAQAVAMLTDWIDTMPLAPWAEMAVGTVERAGGAQMFADGSVVVAGGHGSVSRTGDSFYYLYQPTDGSFDLRAQWDGLTAGSPGGWSGLMTRANGSATSPFGWIRVDQEGKAAFLSRPAAGLEATLQGELQIARGSWVRLLRQGSNLVALVSAEGSDWISLGQAEIKFDGTPSVGLAVTADGTDDYSSHRWADVQLVAGTLTEPADGTVLTQPSKVALSAELIAGTNLVRRVVFKSGETVLGETTHPPYRVVWTNALSGDHAVTAFFEHVSGYGFSSAPRRITVMPVDAAVRTTLAADVTTRGSWPGTYGTQGHIIAGDSYDLPPLAEITMPGAATWVWEWLALEDRGLVRGGMGSRLAAAWFHQEALAVEVRLRDDSWHELALYFLDWEGGPRLQEIQIVDLATGSVLGTTAVSNFQEGRYVRLAVRGQVGIRIRSLTSATAVLSGIFLDPSKDRPPAVHLSLEGSSTQVVLPTTLTLTAQAVDPDGTVAHLAVYADDVLLAESDSSPLHLVWPDALAGTRRLVARATDAFGNLAESAGLNLELLLPPPDATFLGEDRATQGDWAGRYGAEGRALAGRTAEMPAAVGWTAPDHPTFVWSSMSSEPRTLRVPPSTMGIAAAWYDREVVSFHLGALDGHPRVIGLYFLDYDSFIRQSTIRLVDAPNERILDTRTLADFHDGTYLSWQIQGDVRIDILAVQGNAVVNAVFVDIPRPRIQSIVVQSEGAAHRVRITWSSFSGRQYWLQSRQSLQQGEWTSLAGPVPSLGTSSSTEVLLPAHPPHRFFRVVAEP